MSAALLRPATLHDLSAINSIYNHYVLTSTATWQTEPETAEARIAWFRGRDPEKHPVKVIEMGGIIAAWGSLSPFGKREAFAPTVENSIYVHPDFQRRGFGRWLLADQIQTASAAGHHTLIAAISAEQDASLSLHLARGFHEAGRLREAGWKFGRRLDLVYLQKLLGSGNGPDGGTPSPNSSTCSSGS